MEPQTDQTPKSPESIQRWSGIAALVLLFFTSASMAAAYASHIEADRSAQTASAAAAVRQFPSVAIEAKAAFIQDLGTGEVLFEHNADTQLPVASLAKVALLLALSDVLEPEAIITIPSGTASSNGEEPLHPGDKWTERDLIAYTLMVSSNDGARILAAASESALRAAYPKAPQDDIALWRMNEMARALHLTNTYFLNISGLDASATQAGAYGSARDIAALFAHAASSSSLFDGTTHAERLFRPTGYATRAVNTNKALAAIPGLILGKTGQTPLSGGNLAVVFEAGGHPVVAVVLGSTEDGRFDDMIRLVQAADEYLRDNSDERSEN